MNIVKIIAIFNWIVIGILALLVSAETLFPAKGGDAAGRGMGLAIYYLAIIALVVLLVLNLLPYNWAKYTAFAFVAVPFLWIQLMPSWQKYKRRIKDAAEWAKPIYEDPWRDRMARAVRDGEPEKLRQILEKQEARLNQDGELLGYAIGEASGASYRPDEKRACVRLLFDAGARLDSINSEVSMLMAPAANGDAKMLRLLLEHGADANAQPPSFHCTALFEALGGYIEPEASVRTLLEFGADPNATAVFDDEDGPITPLIRAAVLERWNLCLILLEKGANPDFKTKQGKSLREFVQEADGSFTGGGYSTREDFEKLKKALH